MPELQTFKIWCQNVLPLVYDDSLSYYEVLCKCVEYINNLISTDNTIIKDIDKLQSELKIVENWIENFQTEFAENIIANAIATMVFFGLTENGYFIAYIPENWDEIQFQTSGYDTYIPMMEEYGHLCLAY